MLSGCVHIGVRLPEKKSLSSLLHKVTSWFDDPEFLQERKTGLESYLRVICSTSLKDPPY